MSILSLSIVNFRNIIETDIILSNGFNLFYGDNAAGKTSLLEAIYCLGMGKSFRSSQHERIIRHNESYFRIFAHLLLDLKKIPVGMQRSLNGDLQIHLNEKKAKSAAEVSYHLPLIFIGSASHRILTDGPKPRRQFLDWGLFHVYPTFYSQWRDYQRLLMHRNAALKSRAHPSEILAWNHQLAAVGESLHVMRQAYVSDFLPYFINITSTLLKDIHISINYLPGWKTESSLEAALSQHMDREYYLGYTLYGPHRADLSVCVNNCPAQDVLSQGQQKLISYALRLAQGIHFQETTSRQPIFLIDDLASELDLTKRAAVIQILSTINAQVFITSIEAQDLIELSRFHPETRMFHVKHGVIGVQEAECFT